MPFDAAQAMAPHSGWLEATSGNGPLVHPEASPSARP